jgi:hypothetical protein
MQVAPRMKLPMTAVLRLDAPRRQLAQRQLHATLDPYNTHEVDTTSIVGNAVPLEADETAVLAYVPCVTGDLGARAQGILLRGFKLDPENETSG